MARGSGCVPVVSVGVPHVAGILVLGPEVLAVCCSRPDDLRSWSLGGPDAEAVTGGMEEEALKRRVRRTHCGRPSDSPGALGQFLPRSLFGFAFVLYGEVEYCFPWRGLRLGKVGSRRILRGCSQQNRPCVVVGIGHGVCGNRVGQG